MCSERRRHGLTLAALLALAAIGASAAADAARNGPVFYPDDPLLVDDDTAFDASGFAEVELSEAYDFLTNTFASPGDRSDIRAVNVNTLDEVPDSSWFTNRIGVRDLTTEEVVRGPNKFERLDAGEWLVVRGKGPGGFQPGFRAVHAGDPEQIYQLEVDPQGYPQLATGAELVGTLIYHALGYNVVDVYAIRVDPRRIRISERATIRDASGERRFTRADLDAILRQAARDARGHVYMSATRFEEGEDMGQFEYHGTRPDDPNDIYPHEHRRELRANRVFAAWLAHDDSRAVNTLNMRVEQQGRTYIRHYMYDFGAMLGSATRFPEPAANNHEYFIDRQASLRSLLTLGLSVPPYLRRADGDDVPASIGAFGSASFAPERWKPNYPNAAFANMRADDAFWGARLVSRFTDEMLHAIAQAVGYDDPRAAPYLARTLIERRNRIARVWLNGVNPVVDPKLGPDGTLTFVNAAVKAGAATGASTYVISWARFDNDTGAVEPVGAANRSPTPNAAAPRDLLASSTRFILATIRSEHPDHAAWAQPVRVYFRREPDRWRTVGLFRGH
ncbi:MAG TPA: hypothetical protein VD833_23680 [Vicinamibacterales bacterium]|nr:hypothetical protein [Vicinamibacterales bacterium]